MADPPPAWSKKNERRLLTAVLEITGKPAAHYDPSVNLYDRIGRALTKPYSNKELLRKVNELKGRFFKRRRLIHEGQVVEGRDKRIAALYDTCDKIWGMVALAEDGQREDNPSEEKQHEVKSCCQCRKPGHFADKCPAGNKAVEKPSEERPPEEEQIRGAEPSDTPSSGLGSHQSEAQQDLTGMESQDIPQNGVSQLPPKQNDQKYESHNSPQQRLYGTAWQPPILRRPDFSPMPCPRPPVWAPFRYPPPPQPPNYNYNVPNNNIQSPPAPNYPLFYPHIPPAVPYYPRANFPGPLMPGFQPSRLETPRQFWPNH